MADRYWVGGAGTWDTTSTTNWSTATGGASGASVPTSADSVFFDQAGTYSVTMTSVNLFCLDLTVSAGTVSFITGTTPALTISGSMSLLAGTVWSSTGLVTFNATTTGKTITTNGTIINGSIYIGGNSAGGWTLGSALSTAVTGTTTLDGGTLNLGGFDLTTGQFTSSFLATRSIVFGANNIVLAYPTAGQTVLSMAIATGFTWTGTGGFTSAMSVTRIFTFGTTSSSGSTTNAPNVTLTGTGTAVATFTTGSWFNKLDFGTTAFAIAATSLNLNALTLSASGTYSNLTATMVGTGTITPNGKTVGVLNIDNISGTTTLAGAFGLTLATAITTLTSGTFDLAGFTYTTGVFSSTSTGSTARAVAFGIGSITLVHTTAGATVVEMSTANGFTCTGTGGFIASAAITRTFNIGQLNTTFTSPPSLTLTTGTAVQTLTTGGYFNKLDFGTTTFTLATTTLHVTSLILSTTGTFTGLGLITQGTGSINTNGKTISNIDVQAVGGTTTLAGAVTTSTLTISYVSAGTLDLAGFTLSVGSFSISTTNVTSIAFGTGNIVLTDATALVTALSASNATNFTWTGTGGFLTAADSTKTLTFGTTGGSITKAPNVTLTGSGTSIVTFTNNSWFNKLDFGTTAFVIGSGVTLNLNSLTLSTGGTFTNLTANMVSTGTITPNGKTLGALTINSTSGTTTLAGALVISASATTTLTSGTLDLAGFTLTTGIFSSQSSLTRAIAFGSGNIVLNSSIAASLVLAMNQATNFTWTGTGGFIADASNTRTFAFGSTSSSGTSTNAPNLTLTSGVAVATFTTGSWFNKLDFGTTQFNIPVTSLNLNSLTLSINGTFINLTAVMAGTGTITSNTNASLGALNINSVTGTTTLAAAFTLLATGTTTTTSGTLDLNGFTLTTGIFASSGTATRAIAFGTNNIVLAHTTAATTVLSFATATGFTWTGTGGFTSAMTVTRTFTFGTTGGSVTTSPNLSITSGASVPTFIDGSWFNTLNFTGSTCTPAVSASAIGIAVSTLTLATGGTYTGLVPVFTRTQTWTAQFSKQLGGIGFNLASGTLTLDNTQTYTGTSICILTAGTLDLGGSNLTIGIFYSQNANTRAIAFGANNIVLAHTTASTIVLDAGIATNFTWTGTGGFTTAMTVARNFRFGDISSSGNTTNAPNLSITSGAATAQFNASSWFKSLNFTGSTSSATLATPGVVYVDTLTLATGGTYNASSPYAFTPSFTRTQTWTAQFSKQLGGIGCNIPGGTLTLDNTQTYIATSTCTLTAGTLDLGGFDLTVGQFSGSGTTTRAVAFGTNNIVLVHTTAATVVLSVAVATGFTWTGTGGFTADASITRTFTFGTTGGSATNSVNLTLTGAGTAIPTLTTGSWFNTLNFGSTAFTLATTSLNVNTLTLSSGGTFTGLTPIFTRTQTWTAQFSKQLAGLSINIPGGTLTLDGTQTYIATSICLLTAGTLNLGGFDLTIGIFSSSNSNTRAVAFGTNNIVLAHTTASTLVLNMVTATGFTLTGTGGFTADASIIRLFSFGNGAGGSADNSPNLTLTGSGTAIPSFSGASWFNKLDFGTTAFTIATVSLNLNALTLSTGGTFTGLTPTMRGTGTITSNGKTIASLVINSTSGTTTLASALASGTYIQTSGNVDFATFNLTCSSTASYTAGTLSNIGTISCTIWTVQGAFTLSQGTITPSTSFVVSSGSFTYNGGTLSPVGTFTHTAGTVTLGQSYALTATGTYTLTAGTLDLGGFTLTTGIFSSSNSNTRSIAFGLGNIVLAHTTAATTVLSMPTATGFTWTGTGGFTSTMSVTRTFNFGATAGGTAANAPNLTLTSGASIATFTTNSWFNKLDFGTTAFTIASVTLNLGGLTLSTTGTFTSLNAFMVGTGTITFNGKAINTLTVNSVNGTTTLAGAVSCAGYNQTSGDVNFATFNLTTTTTSVAYTSGNWTNIGTITCIGFVITGALTLTQGNITLSSGTFDISSGSFTYNGGVLTVFGQFRQIAGDVTLGKALTVPTIYTLTAGTLDLSTYTLTTNTIASTGTLARAIIGSNAILNINGSGATAWSNASATGWSSSGFTINMTSASAKTFAGGGASYPTLNQGGAGALTISGDNTFTDITATTRPSTITFTAGSTQTVSAFTLAGTVGSLVTINSSTAGTPFTLTRLSGLTNTNYLSIKDSTATGGSGWYAGTTSTNVSNNTGWTFSAAPVVATNSGNFFAFF